MSGRRPAFDQLQVMLAVVEEGGFSKAALRLNRAQSAATHAAPNRRGRPGAGSYGVCRTVCGLREFAPRRKIGRKKPRGLYPRGNFLFKGAMSFRARSVSRRIIGPVRA
jgi:hypothetical protein